MATEAPVAEGTKAKIQKLASKLVPRKRAAKPEAPADPAVVAAEEASVEKSFEMPEIHNFKDAHGKYAEAYSMGTEFSTISDDLHVIHPFTYCKDFIQDLYWGRRIGKPISIYSFSWNPEKDKEASHDPGRMLVRNNKFKGDMPERAVNCQEFIRLFEAALGVRGTTFCAPVEKHNCVYIESRASEWTFFPAMVSLWTLIMRVGFTDYKAGMCPEGTPLKTVLEKLMEVDSLIKSPARDLNRIKAVHGFLDKLENGKFRSTFESYTFEHLKTAGVSEVHNGSGIMSTISKVTGKSVGY